MGTQQLRGERLGPAPHLQDLQQGAGGGAAARQDQEGDKGARQPADKGGSGGSGGSGDPRISSRTPAGRDQGAESVARAA
eukprot:8564881-Pyramimonas_sp.AAC.1